MLESAAVQKHLFDSPWWCHQKWSTSLDHHQGFPRLGFGVFRRITPQTRQLFGSCKHNHSVCMWGGCVKLYTIFHNETFEHFRKEVSSGSPMNVRALVALILYYTAQFITNHKVILGIPEKPAEFCGGQSHTLGFDKLSTSKTNRTCPSSAYFVRWLLWCFHCQFNLLSFLWRGSLYFWWMKLALQLHSERGEMGTLRI